MSNFLTCCSSRRSNCPNSNRLEWLAVSPEVSASRRSSMECMVPILVSIRCIRRPWAVLLLPKSMTDCVNSCDSLLHAYKSTRFDTSTMLKVNDPCRWTKWACKYYAHMVHPCKHFSLALVLLAGDRGKCTITPLICSDLCTRSNELA